MSSVASTVPPPAVPQGLPPALETSTQLTLPFHSFTRVITTKTSGKKKCLQWRQEAATSGQK